MTSRKSFLAIVAITFFGSLLSATADSWLLPTKKKYYSPNKKYYLEVTPRKLQSQLEYFEDKVANKRNAGPVKGLVENSTKGAFYVRRDDGDYSRKQVFPLVNEVSPVHAVVSNRGDYFVTFDNWHSAGYGENVVVIYRFDGSVIRKFSLEDLLTEGDVRVLYRTVSSIWWGGEHHIDDHKGLLVLKIVGERRSSGDEGSKSRELKIDLATGSPLEPKKDLFPELQVVGIVEAQAASEPSAISPSEPKCSSPEQKFDSVQAARIPSKILNSRAQHLPIPTYPEIAKAAHAEGTVVVELLISRSGEVICARTLSGHPLLRGTSVVTALNWKFDPFEVSESSSTATGTVAFTFRLSTKEAESRRH